MAAAASTSSSEANKALVRRAIGYNHGVADDGPEIFAPDFVAHLPGQPPMDRATLERFVAGVSAGIAGSTYEIPDQIGQGIWLSTGSPGGASTPPTSPACPRPGGRSSCAVSTCSE